MKLLEVLPTVARLSQVRFASNFQNIAWMSCNIEVNKTLYIIHEQNETVDYEITYDLNAVISAASEFGKDCQIIKVEKSGDVESLN